MQSLISLSRYRHGGYRRLLLCPPLFALLYVGVAISTCAQKANAQPFDIKNPHPALDAIRLKHNLPGLGAAVVTEEGLQLLSVTGVRKKGERIEVTEKDLWHLGSCGKALTATMIARLVEDGKLSYQQTMGDTFPELVSKMSERFKKIRLIDLLSHTSGLPPNFNLQNYVNEKSVTRARRKVLREAIETPLLSNPGERYSYSNWGYTLAGHMAEKVTRRSWESLMKAEVFKPLQMSTAGFGGTGTPGKIDQPWPHAASGGPMPSNGKEMDNLPVMGPAGTIHMSLEDWGKFVSEHLKGHLGKSRYLSQASFEKLHTAVKENYALGWMSLPRPWAGGNALHHGGDNTMNNAIVWAAPDKRFAVLVVTNQSTSGPAADEVASGLLVAWQAGPQKAPLQTRGRDFPKRAPFRAVRWRKNEPVVNVHGEWFTLISIDKVAATEIVGFSQESYGDKWKKRFEEDLVEVLAGMGNEPEDTVELVVKPLKESKTRTLIGVAMTEANRQAIRAAAAGHSN